MNTFDQLLETVNRTAITPALALLPASMDTPAARVLLLAIGLQESGLTKRVQVVDGGKPGAAHGLWQNEQGGAVRGVLNHPASHLVALRTCQVRGVAPNSAAVWDRLATDDVLAAAFARLLIFTDSAPLPGTDDIISSWRLYAERCWRPGRPKPDTWPGFHMRARDYVMQAHQ